MRFFMISSRILCESCEELVFFENKKRKKKSKKLFLSSKLGLQRRVSRQALLPCSSC